MYLRTRFIKAWTLLKNFNLSNLVQDFKTNMTEKWTPFVSTKLQMNYRRSFNRTVKKTFLQNSFKDFSHIHIRQLFSQKTYLSVISATICITETVG